MIKKYLIVKRLADLFFALIIMVFLSPILLIISVMIKTQSIGPVFYRGARTGQFGRPFRIFKFRTMVENAEKVGGPSSAFNDPRFTKIGKILRRYKLDELPQLINILKGEMSFVGPRPQVEEYTSKYEGEEKMILSVKPGLTDYASIEFINLDKILGDENVDEKYRKEVEPRKNELRLKYVKEKSFWTDIRIIFRTVVKFFKLKKLWSIED
jgi:lipopolysaccharide/colanic/teichoic acid biosynthesis glycosyltransferase